RCRCASVSSITLAVRMLASSFDLQIRSTGRHIVPSITKRYTSIEPLALSASQEEQLVAFLVSLTDKRVKYKKAPFDHPEIRIPADGRDTAGTRRIKAVGDRGSMRPLRNFLNLDPQDAIFTPRGLCEKDSS
ncbi:MAG: hypothetical protein ACREXM_00995, partial [Gammaproteobacteria bacterium]